MLLEGRMRAWLMRSKRSSREWYRGGGCSGEQREAPSDAVAVGGESPTIQRENGRDAEPLGHGDEGGVGVIHGKYLVALHEAGRASMPAALDAKHGDACGDEQLERCPCTPTAKGKVGWDWDYRWSDRSPKLTVATFVASNVRAGVAASSWTYPRQGADRDAVMAGLRQHAPNLPPLPNGLRPTGCAASVSSECPRCPLYRRGRIATIDAYR